jgi:hypothetical protein
MRNIGFILIFLFTVVVFGYSPMRSQSNDQTNATEKAAKAIQVEIERLALVDQKNLTWKPDNHYPGKNKLLSGSYLAKDGTSARLLLSQVSDLESAIRLYRAETTFAQFKSKRNIAALDDEAAEFIHMDGRCAVAVRRGNYVIIATAISPDLAHKVANYAVKAVDSVAKQN